MTKTDPGSTEHGYARPKIDDGGQFFPAPMANPLSMNAHYNAYPAPSNTHYVSPPQVYYGRGVSLRQWYAGQVLAGLVAHPGIMINGVESMPVLASTAFAMADAMIAADKEGR